MLAPSGEVLRAGLTLKLNQVKRATRAYVRDRTHQATGTVTAYAVAAGLFAAAGIFVLAALLVGIMALFRWVEIHYGMFWAFGTIGALLLIVAAILAGVGMSKLKRPAPHYPSLASRIGAAIRANPIRPEQADAVKELATSIPLAPAAPADRDRVGRWPDLSANSTGLQLALLAAATLLGWAAMRRRQELRRAHSRPMET
jgi:putative superfamily III holin-X